MDHDVRIPQPVRIVYTGQQGRPQKAIDLAYLKEATSNSWQIKLMELACTLGVHRNTLRLYMNKNGIERAYSTLSNAELDQLVIQFKTRHPESGLRYVVGHLRAHGHRVQYRRILQSLRRVDRIGQVL